jgi:DNA polymerase-3 subunit beta
MKFRVEAIKLAERLGLIQGIAERRATMPILSHVLVIASDGKIKLTVTDLETTMTTWCEGNVLKEGGLTLPARKLYEIVKELSQGCGSDKEGGKLGNRRDWGSDKEGGNLGNRLQGEIEIEEIGNHWTQIRSQSATFKIAGLPAEDFPSIPQLPLDNLFQIESRVLDDIIGKTIFAVSPDDMRRNLSGIYFEKGDGRTLRLVATDGHRLSLAEKGIEDDIKLKKGVVVPKKGVSELRKMVKLDESVKIGCGKTDFVAQSSEISLVVRLIDAEFPDYRQVIPENTKITFHVKRDEFLSALRRVSILSAERTKSIKMSIASGKMTLASVSPELGEAKEVVPIDYTGDSLELGFNAKYLMDVLEVVGGDTVQLRIIDELSPVVIKPVDEEEIYISVIMPMRV